MRYTLLFSMLILVIASCTKDKFSSTPTLKFKSVNTTQLHNQQLLIFTLSFTDAQGDFANNDSSLLEQQIVPTCTNSNSLAYFPLPPFPATQNTKGDINITLAYNVGGYTGVTAPQCQQNDTATFRFVLKDNANHVSDTVSSPKIILFYP